MLAPSSEARDPTRFHRQRGETDAAMLHRLEFRTFGDRAVSDNLNRLGIYEPEARAAFAALVQRHKETIA